VTTTNNTIKERSFSGNDARRLLRRARTGTLGSLNRDDGGPYVSVANIVTDHAGRPLILISRLAWHTQNLLVNSKASLIVSELPSEGDALTGARVTVMGEFEQLTDPGLLRQRYIARHPAAAGYADFADFSFWLFKPKRVHAVAGFGRIETMEADEVFLNLPEWRELEQSAIVHINSDHASFVQKIGVRSSGNAAPWCVVSIDPDGFDLANNERVIREQFSTVAKTGDELRAAFAEMVKSEMM